MSDREGPNLGIVGGPKFDVLYVQAINALACEDPCKCNRELVVDQILHEA